MSTTPPHPLRLLILGGTAEAAELAHRAHLRFGPRLDVITSLAGRLVATPSLPGRMRRGPFGGPDGLARFLADAAIDVVIDATHPFAAQISAHAVAACRQQGTPLLRLQRPAWQPRPGDRWIDAHSMADAARHLAGLATRVFLTTGPGSLAAFASLPRIHFLVRSFEPPPQPLPLADHELIIARPPFTAAAEQALMAAHRIEALVTKNAGGPLSAKLDAARALALPVVMIRRPEPAADEADLCPDVESALERLTAILPA
jgi:precorrin-6A/cobalt-precorrin-6A reductase